MSMRRVLTVAVLLSILIPSASYAAIKTWDGGGGADTNWGNPLNWSPDGVPTAADDVEIRWTPSAWEVTTDDPSIKECRSLLIDGADLYVSGSTSGRITIQGRSSGGDLTVMNMGTLDCTSSNPTDRFIQFIKPVPSINIMNGWLDWNTPRAIKDEFPASWGAPIGSIYIDGTGGNVYDLSGITCYEIAIQCTNTSQNITVAAGGTMLWGPLSLSTRSFVDFTGTDPLRLNGALEAYGRGGIFHCPVRFIGITDITKSIPGVIPTLTDWTVESGASLTINNPITIPANGILTNLGTLTLGATLTVQGELALQTPVGGGGHVTFAADSTLGIGATYGFSSSYPVFTCSGGYSLGTPMNMHYFGGSTQTGNLCPGTLSSLILDVDTNISITNPVSVIFSLDLKRGKVLSGANIHLDPNAGVFCGPFWSDGDRTGFIDAPFSRDVDMSIPYAGFDFPVGKTKLANWQMGYLTNTATSGSMTVDVREQVHPDLPFGKPVIWTVTRSSQLTGVLANVVLQYLDNQMPNPADLIVRRYHDGTYENFTPDRLTIWPWGIVVHDVAEIAGEWTLGSSVPTSGPNIVLFPVPITFPVVYKTTQAQSQYIYVENTGNAPLNFTGAGVSLGGPDAASFTLSGVNTTPIPAGGYRTFQLYLDTSSAGHKSADVVFTTDDYDSPTTSVAVTADVINPQLSMDPPYSAWLGNYHADTGSTTALITMTNSGETELIFTSPTAIVADPAAFTLSPISTDPLAPGASRTFTVTFDPPSTGSYYAMLNFYTNMMQSQTLYQIGGTGDLPDIGSSILSVDFGNKVTTEGRTKARCIPIINGSQLTLDISSYSIVGPDASDFVITNSPALVIGPIPPQYGQNKVDVHVAFDPSTPGPKTAALQVLSNDPDEPVFTVPLSGTGVLYRGTTVYGPYTGLGPGVSTIGTGGDYTSMSLAAKDIGKYSLTGGDWTFLILHDLTERAPTAITQYHTNGNKVVFRPAAGTNPTVTYTLVIGQVRPFGGFMVGYQTTGTLPGIITTPSYYYGYQMPTDGVVLDGCNQEGGTARNLKIIASPSGYGYGYNAVGFVGGCDQCAVRNCDILSTGTMHNGESSCVSTYNPGNNPDVARPSYPAIDAGALDNFTVENCKATSLVGPYPNGIAVGGSSGYTYEAPTNEPNGTGILIRNNEVVAGGRGILVGAACEATVSGNTVRLVPPTTPIYTSRVGIVHQNSYSGSFTTGVVNILGNRVFGEDFGTGYQNPVYGIQLNTPRSTLTYNVFNNMVGGREYPPNGSATNCYGIAYTGYGHPTMNIGHNSINMPATTDTMFITTDPAPLVRWGIAVTQGSYAGHANIYNNLVRIGQMNGCALYFASGPTGQYASNGNCLYLATAAKTGQYGMTSQYNSLADWQAGTGFDANSVALDPMAEHPPALGKWLPVCANAGDLHFHGDPGAGFRTSARVDITTDIDLELRSPTLPYIGADEIVDSDGDGVPDITETGSGRGDGNNDGTSDSLQANVATVASFATGEFFTIVGPAGTQLQDVAVIEQPLPGDAPAGVSFPYGFLKFKLTGITPGATVLVQVLVPESRGITGYHKYGASAGNSTQHYYGFDFDGQSGTQVNGTVVNLRLVDGGRGDDDRTVNGVIVDPGAPSVGSSTVVDWSAY